MDDRAQRVPQRRGPWILYFPESGQPGSWLVSTAIGGDYFQNWEEGFSGHWFRYADRYGLGIAIAVEDLSSAEEPQLNGSWQKLLAVESLSRTLGGPVRCALIDTDVLISPLADDVFLAVPPGHIGVVSQVNGLPMEFRRLSNRIAFLRREFIYHDFPLNSLLNATPRQVFEWAGLHPAMDDFACAGVIVCDSASHGELFEEWYREAPSDESYLAIGDWEQTYVNHRIQQRPDVRWLDYSWQALWMYEVAAHYPFLYSPAVEPEVVQWCLTASLLKHHFLHLAGRWEKAPDTRSVPRLPEVAEMEDLILRLRSQDHASEPAQMRGKILPSHAPS